MIPNKQKVTVTRDIKFLNITPSVEEPVNSVNMELRNYETTIDSGDTPVLRESCENPEDLEDEQDIPTEGSGGESHIVGSTGNRGPGRSRKLLTGRRGRPRKVYQPQQGGEHHIESVEEDVAQDSDHETSPGVTDAEANLISFSSEIPCHQALVGPNQKEWKEAIIKEIECLINNDTWEIVDRPNKRPIIGCRIVLRNKRDSEGRIERRKACLVARGFAQRPGIDYHDTFASVARLESLRLLIALAAKHNLKIHQVDVTTAYLHGTIEEEIYMELPEQLEESLEEIVSRKGNKTAVGIKAKKMLEDLKGGNKTCRLKRALYGLKQAGRQWHRRLNEKLQSLGLKPINADPCVFSSEQEEKTLFVLVYVDDILIFYQNKRDLNNICEGLLQDFNIKDLGEARYCLGIEIARRDDQITISQSGYIRELLSRFGMNDCNPVYTPIEIGAKLDRTTDEHNGIHGTRPYQELIGALNYLAVATRPDISHIVSRLSQFNTCHNERH